MPDDKKRRARRSHSGISGLMLIKCQMLWNISYLISTTINYILAIQANMLPNTAAILGLLIA
jgi:hypothetical protein